jgi:flagellar motor switch protein FliG
MASSPNVNANDITSVISSLAQRQAGKAKAPPLPGPKRAAILMLALGEQYGGKVWSLLDDDEVRELSIHMSTLGTVEADVVEDMLLEFVSRMSASGALMGNFDATERLLQQYLPAERVVGIMDEIRGPAGRNMWEKLSNVQEEVLANYLKNEYPQTIAVVLSKLKPEHSARDPARGHGARCHQPHAEDGSGAKGSHRACRTDAARRVYVEPVADQTAGCT